MCAFDLSLSSLLLRFCLLLFKKEKKQISRVGRHRASVSLICMLVLARRDPKSVPGGQALCALGPASKAGFSLFGWSLVLPGNCKTDMRCVRNGGERSAQEESSVF